METINYIEWIGYIGSVIIAISLTMTSMVKLRWANLVGALIFSIYGLTIQAIPVVLVNGFITLIDAYYLFKMYTTKDYFTLQQVKADNEFLREFVAFYQDLIPKDFPDFNYTPDNQQISFLVLRDMQVASVFMGRRINENTLAIELDFAIPQYRDFKTGDFLFNKNKALFKAEGIQQLVVKPYSKMQHKYYSKVGFKAQEHKKDYVKLL